MLRHITAALLLLLATHLSAQVDDPETSFDILRSIEGVWFMPDDRGDRLEIWEVLNDSTMIGRGVRVKAENGDSVLLESIWLERRDTLITYKVTVKGQNQGRQIVYTLTEAYRDEFLFENPRHDNPKKIKYLLLGNREMQVSTEGVRNNRTVTEEYVFEREFNPSTVEFRLKGGLNTSSLMIDGAFNNFPGGGKPVFGWRPGWDFGAQMAFKGAGGFITINTELGFAGRYSHVKSNFFVDSINYVRDGTMNSVWMQLAVLPEIMLKRDGRISVILGPYYGRLVYSRARGTALPGPDSKLFETNNDLKKNDFGIHLGAQYRLKTKKDIGAKIGLRANYGLTDVDNLYIRRCDDSSLLCNSRVVLRGVSMYYSFNLLKL